MDLYLFKLINLTLIHPVLDGFCVMITGKQFWLIPGIVLIAFLVFFNGKRGRIVFVLLLLSVSLSDMSTYRWLKPTFKRLRPCHQLEDVRSLEKCRGKWGMPSNHAANFFAAALILSLFYRRFVYLFYSIAFLSGAYSRIYVGKHFPGDVLVGALWGTLIAIVVYYSWVVIRTRLEKQEKYFMSLSR